MSQTAIPLEFERYLQNQISAGDAPDMNEMIFAHIPGLDPSQPINRENGLPDTSLWVHQQDIDQVGKLGDNALAYSVVIPGTVAEFTFNAIYLRDKNVPNSCGMVVHKAIETKENGMASTKSLVQAYDGAAQIAGITVDASTWQIDYQARLKGIEEDHRLVCLDNYGHTAFVDGFDVIQQADPNKYKVTPGVVYVGGLRGVLTGEVLQTITTKPNGLYVDIVHQGTALSVWENKVTIAVSETELTDYVGGNGDQHYVAKLAGINADGSVVDWRVKGGLDAHKGHGDPHPQYLPKFGATITQPIALNYESISMAVFDIRNLKPDAYWTYINMACGVNSGGGDIGSVHVGYCTQPADGAPAHSFHMRIRGDKTQMSWNYGYVKAHVPLYDESGELVANRKQMAQLPLYPEILTDDKKFIMSLSGTILTVANNQVIRMRGWRDIDTSSLTRTFTIGLTGIYHLRFSVEKGLYVFYVEHPEYNPDGLPETDKKFDSTYDDALIAKIENGVITPLINTSETFNLTYDGLPNSADSQASGNDWVGSFELPLNWSRTPVSDSIEQKGHLSVSNSHAWNDSMVVTVLAMREDAVLCPVSFDKSYKLNRYECRFPVAHGNGRNTTGYDEPTPHLQTFEKIVRVYGY